MSCIMQQSTEATFSGDWFDDPADTDMDYTPAVVQQESMLESGFVFMSSEVRCNKLYV